jgi:two-component system sensor histidine kinase RegB
MASPRTPGLEPEPAPDKPGSSAVQAALDWDQAGARRGRLRARTLVTLRWVLLAMEVGAVAFSGVALGYDGAYPFAIGVIAAGAWVNLLTGVASPGQRLFSDAAAGRPIRSCCCSSRR